MHCCLICTFTGNSCFIIKISGSIVYFLISTELKIFFWSYPFKYIVAHCRRGDRILTPHLFLTIIYYHQVEFEARCRWKTYNAPWTSRDVLLKLKFYSILPTFKNIIHFLECRNYFCLVWNTSNIKISTS